MTTYQDITRLIGDQWVAALKQVGDAAGAAAEKGAEARAGLALPQMEVPEELTRLREQLAGQLPKPAEIIEANYQLTERLLTAQRDLALRFAQMASTVGQDASSSDATTSDTKDNA